MASNVDIAIRAKNEASGAIRQVSADLGNLDDAAQGVGGGLGNLGGLLAGGLIAGGLTMLADQAIGAAGAIYDLAKSAASFDALKASFNDLASSAGQSADAMLASLQRASFGMISDADLMLSANKAMMLGVADTSQEMVALLDVARVRGKAMGLSVTEAFNDIVTGLGRESALILDNLGITLDLDRTYKEYAAGLDKTVSALTAVERKQALVNKVMEDSKSLNTAAPGASGQAFAQLDASLANFKITAGTLAEPIAAEIAAGAAQGLGNLSRILNESLAQEDMSGAGKFGYALGLGIKEAVIAGLGAGGGGKIEFRTLFSDDFLRSATEAGLATRKAILEGMPEIQNAAAAALGDVSGMTKPEQQRKKLQELESQIQANFDAVMEDTRVLTKLMDTGNNDLMAPVFDVRAGHLAELKRVRQEYATLMEGMRNVPGPVLPVSDSLWDSVTGWRDLTRAAKDAVSPTQQAAQAEAAAATASADAATEGFNFAVALDAVTFSSNTVADAISAAGNAVGTIRGLMVDAAAAGGDQARAMEGFANAGDMENQAANLARTLSSLGIDDTTIAYTIQLNTAEAIAGAREFANEAQKAASTTANLTTEADRAKAALILAGYATASFASGLSQVQAQAGATMGVIYNLTSAIGQLNAVTGVMRSNSDLLGGITGQLNGVTSGLIDNMGIDGALAKGQELKVQARDQIESLRKQGYTTAEIGVIMQANVQKTQQWASDLDKVEQATGGVGAATKAVNDEYETLKGKVSSVLQGALTPDIGFDPSSILPRPDDINENARRIAAIANEGIIGQPWLEDFKNTAPQAWSDIMAQVAQGVDAKAAAAQIYQDFQQGLRPDLIDKDLVKQRVKAMIIGDQNMAALAEEIAGELATEMGIPLSQALAAAGGAMGVTTGAAGDAAKAAGDATGGTDMTAGGVSAGQTWIAGFLAQADGTQIVAGIVAKLTAEMPKFLDAGKGAGTQWGAGFMSTVESGIANPLINLLVTLVTPGIMAQMAAGKSQTEPPQ